MTRVGVLIHISYEYFNIQEHVTMPKQSQKFLSKLFSKKKKIFFQVKFLEFLVKILGKFWENFRKVFENFVLKALELL